jgi:acyl carrier protein
MKEVTIEEIITIIRVQLGLGDVAPEQRFMEDLGAESADMINIIATTEDKFDISFDEEEISTIRSVQQLYEKVNDIIRS